MSSLWDRPNGPQSIAASPTNQSGLNAQSSLNPIQPATLVLSAAAEVVVPHPQNPAIAFVLPLVGSQGDEQTMIDLIASGIVTTGQATNVTLKLYSGTSLTLGSDSILGSSGAIAVNSTTCPWRCHGELIYDSVSGKLHGVVEWLLNNTLVVKTALSTVITGLKDLNSPVANFVLSGTSSAATGPLPTTISVKKFCIG